MNKQTAVEWLAGQFEESYSYINEIFKETIEQAKAMEREQMKEMYLKGIENYDSTFKRKGGEQ
jgi:hypothetical protein